MAPRQPRYSMEEFARRGDEIYERDVRSKVEATSKGKFVAIDIESGDWELADSELVACHGLEARRPDAQTWLVRVGYRYVHRIGAPAVRFSS